MKENTPNKTPIITLEVIAQRKAEKLEEVQQDVYKRQPYSNASDNIMQQNSFNPYFIKSELLNF